ncbi:MAG TPA: hypothetical protein VE692_06170 [Nitrososphaera sp.]|nr:hypothetical protein [Nitrososphaera sp.]
MSICIGKAVAADDALADQTSYEDGNNAVMFLIKAVCSFPWNLRSILHDFQKMAAKNLIKFRPFTVHVLNKKKMKMPKPGFKTITVKEHIFSKYYELYKKAKKERTLIKENTSFSGFVTSMMQETMAKYEAFAKHAPFLEKFAIEQDRVIIKDNKRNRIAEVMVRNGELQCLLDEKTDCIHIGFVYSLPEIYTVLEKKKKSIISATSS